MLRTKRFTLFTPTGGRPMKSRWALLAGCLLVAGMTFGVSGITSANGRDRCTDPALDGFYVFTASGFDIVSGVS